MGTATHQIVVGTWVANVYLRHPYVCAQGAALTADATEGRFVLGLGVSHQPVNEALRVDMQHPPTVLRRYVTEVRRRYSSSSMPKRQRRASSGSPRSTAMGNRALTL